VSVLVAADEHGLRRRIAGTNGAVSLADACPSAERRSADENGVAMAVLLGQVPCWRCVRSGSGVVMSVRVCRRTPPARLGGSDGWSGMRRIGILA
jgi:hypothetical protein